MKPELQQFLKQLKAYGESENIPNVSERMGEFLNLLVKVHRPEIILEIGTANGYSTVWMGEAAQKVGSVIHGIDFSRPTSEQFRQNMLYVGFNDFVTLHDGNALDVLPKLDLPPVDMVFVDGQKRDYWRFWQLIEPRLAEGALVIFDDMMAFPEKTREFQENIEKVENITKVLIPVDGDDGCLLIYK